MQALQMVAEMLRVRAGSGILSNSKDAPKKEAVAYVGMTSWLINGIGLNSYRKPLPMRNATGFFAPMKVNGRNAP